MDLGFYNSVCLSALKLWSNVEATANYLLENIWDTTEEYKVSYVNEEEGDKKWWRWTK